MAVKKNTLPVSYTHLTAKDVRIGEFEDGQEAHVNMMDFRVGDETMSWLDVYKRQI